MQRFCDIITSRELTDDIFALTLDAGELGLLAKPGQFLHIKCGDGLLLRRPISICDARDGYVKIIFRAGGPGTRIPPCTHAVIAGPGQAVAQC